MRAILLVSHGSRNESAKKEIERLVEELKLESGISAFEAAYLEINEPSIEVGIDHLVSGGAKQIFVLLNFLNAGNHVLKDIPQIVENAQKKYTDIQIDMSPHLGRIPDLKKIFLNQIEIYKNSKE